MFTRILALLRHGLTSSTPRAKKIRLGTLTLLATYYITGRFRRTATNTLVQTSVPWSTFLRDVTNEQVVHAVVDGTTVKYLTKDGGTTLVNVARRLTPHSLPTNILSQLTKSGAIISAATPSRSFVQILIAVLPILYIAAMGGVLYKFYHDSFGGGVGGEASKRVGGSSSGGANGEAGEKTHSFDMVAGVDQAKAEVAEVVDLLRDPSKYAAMGAKVPRGVLLVGPPGTGKTLLAKCVAAEADVPFFYCSGSEFVEIYAGRGASRVRHLFQKARKVAPSIIFIDELDALGKRRSEGFSSNEGKKENVLFF